MTLFNLLKEYSTLEELPRFANRHGLAGLVCDEVVASGENPFDKRGLMRLSGNAQKQSRKYDLQKAAVGSLAKFYEKHGINMFLFKGYALSRLYDNPMSRQSTDIDIYLYDDGAKGDMCIKSCGIAIKQNEEKHSVFSIKGVSVENHAVFINTFEHRQLEEAEKFLEEEARKGLEGERLLNNIILPTPNFYAVFLILHLGGDLVYNCAKLKQFVDWAVFLKKEGAKVDWEKIYGIAERGGFLQFLQCVNRIVVDKFDVPMSCLCNMDKLFGKEEFVGEDKRVLDTIANGVNITPPKNIYGKAVRLLKNQWSHKLVYGQSFLSAYINHTKSYLLTQTGWFKFSIWDKRYK